MRWTSGTRTKPGQGSARRQQHPGQGHGICDLAARILRHREGVGADGGRQPRGDEGSASSWRTPPPRPSPRCPATAPGAGREETPCIFLSPDGVVVSVAIGHLAVQRPRRGGSRGPPAAPAEARGGRRGAPRLRAGWKAEMEASEAEMADSEPAGLALLPVDMAGNICSAILGGGGAEGPWATLWAPALAAGAWALDCARADSRGCRLARGLRASEVSAGLQVKSVLGKEVQGPMALGGVAVVAKVDVESRDDEGAVLASCPWRKDSLVILGCASLLVILVSGSVVVTTELAPARYHAPYCGCEKSLSRFWFCKHCLKPLSFVEPRITQVARGAWANMPPHGSLPAVGDDHFRSGSGKGCVGSAAAKGGCAMDCHASEIGRRLQSGFIAAKAQASRPTTTPLLRQLQQASGPKPQLVGTAQRAMREATKAPDRKVRIAEQLKEHTLQAEQAAIISLAEFEGCQANYHKAVRSLAENVPPAVKTGDVNDGAAVIFRHGLSLGRLLDAESQIEIFADDDLFGPWAEGVELSDGERDEVARRKAEVEQTIKRAVVESFGAVKARCLAATLLGEWNRLLPHPCLRPPPLQQRRRPTAWRRPADAPSDAEGHRRLFARAVQTAKAAAEAGDTAAFSIYLDCDNPLGLDSIHMFGIGSARFCASSRSTRVLLEPLGFTISAAKGIAAGSSARVAQVIRVGRRAWDFMSSGATENIGAGVAGARGRPAKPYKASVEPVKWPAAPATHRRLGREGVKLDKWDIGDGVLPDLSNFERRSVLSPTVFMRVVACVKCSFRDSDVIGPYCLVCGQAEGIPEHRQRRGQRSQVGQGAAREVGRGLVAVCPGGAPQQQAAPGPLLAGSASVAGVSSPKPPGRRVEVLGGPAPSFPQPRAVPHTTYAASAAGLLRQASAAALPRQASAAARDTGPAALSLQQLEERLELERSGTASRIEELFALQNQDLESVLVRKVNQVLQVATVNQSHAARIDAELEELRSLPARLGQLEHRLPEALAERDGPGSGGGSCRSWSLTAEAAGDQLREAVAALQASVESLRATQESHASSLDLLRAQSSRAPKLDVEKQLRQLDAMFNDLEGTVSRHLDGLQAQLSRELTAVRREVEVLKAGCADDDGPGAPAGWQQLESKVEGILEAERLERRRQVDEVSAAIRSESDRSARLRDDLAAQQASLRHELAAIAKGPSHELLSALQVELQRLKGAVAAQAEELGRVERAQQAGASQGQEELQAAVRQLQEGLRAAHARGAGEAEAARAGLLASGAGLREALDAERAERVQGLEALGQRLQEADARLQETLQAERRERAVQEEMGATLREALDAERRGRAAQLEALEAALQKAGEADRRGLLLEQERLGAELREALVTERRERALGAEALEARLRDALEAERRERGEQLVRSGAELREALEAERLELEAQGLHRFREALEAERGERSLQLGEVRALLQDQQAASQGHAMRLEELGQEVASRAAEARKAGRVAVDLSTKCRTAATLAPALTSSRSTASPPTRHREGGGAGRGPFREGEHHAAPRRHVHERNESENVGVVLQYGGNVKLYESDGNTLHKPGRGVHDQAAQQHQTQAIVEGLIKGLATSVAAPQLAQVTKALQAQLNPSVVTSKANLDRAKQREAEAAMTLAQVDFERKQATAAFACEVRGSAEQPEQSTSQAAFDIVWDEDLFKDLDQLEGIETAEKDDLMKIHAELQQYKSQLASKSEDVKSRIARAKELHETIHVRVGKKRKTEADEDKQPTDGADEAQAGGGGGASQVGNTKIGKGTRASRGKGGGAGGKERDASAQTGAISSAKVLNLFDAIFQKISIAETLQASIATFHEFYFGERLQCAGIGYLDRESDFAAFYFTFCRAPGCVRRRKEPTTLAQRLLH
ncbi:unnamed protein product [Prorocentrum cordatum]|uniref:Uncharacterized protein n=1 Tax=Prorocentrum cordatum TaxID=2364126 RepID=A0ABN9QGR1_9DINO|nr:unnamed protein product [Polarella glacialis]